MNDTDDKDGKEGDNGLDATIPAISPKIDNELDVIVAPPPAKNTKLVLNGFLSHFTKISQYHFKYMQIVPEADEEVGYVDSIFGRGTWTRVTDGVFKYAEMRIHSFL